jgi:hypothetical protein
MLVSGIPKAKRVAYPFLHLFSFLPSGKIEENNRREIRIFRNSKGLAVVHTFLAAEPLFLL